MKGAQIAIGRNVKTDMEASLSSRSQQWLYFDPITYKIILLLHRMTR